MPGERRIAIVTGASGGIGEAIAKQLAADGYSVAMLARRIEQLQEVKKDIEDKGGVAEIFQCDASKVEPLTSVIERVQKDMGHVSTIVHNAAAGPSGKTVDKLPLKEWDIAMNLNARASYLMAHLLFPEMREKSFGRMINIASLLGVTGAQNNFAYAASKHAVVGLTKALAAEWGRHGITSNVVCPGYVDTPGLAGYEFENLKERLPMPEGKLGRPEHMAEIVGFMAQESSHYMNGAVIVADGGLISDLGIK